MLPCPWLGLKISWCLCHLSWFQNWPGRVPQILPLLLHGQFSKQSPSFLAFPGTSLFPFMPLLQAPSSFSFGCMPIHGGIFNIIFSALHNIPSSLAMWHCPWIKFVTDCSFFLLDNSFPGFSLTTQHIEFASRLYSLPHAFLPAIRSCPDRTQTQMVSKDRWVITRWSCWSVCILNP